MASLHNSYVGSGAPRPQRGQPQLPAFCRTRRPTVLVSVSSLRSLRALLLVLIALELSTLLLLLAGPLPPRPGISTNTAFRSAVADAGGSSATPRSDR